MRTRSVGDGGESTMTRRMPFSKIVGRAALGLFSAAAVATSVMLFAPVADASPESDATDAINAAWDAAGGDTSQLGPRDGGVYPVGAGFGQNFANGAIYFSPGTGARMMFGAILEKYRALGGPADSDLGFPNIDEGPGRVSPDSRNTTFSAGDNPVIFWTPDTGAWVVRGPINAAWDKLGGSSGVLGVPTADETYNGDVVSQTFTGGQLSFDANTKTFTTEPPDLAGQLAGLNIPSDAASAIATVWRASGGATGPLGLKQGDQYQVGDNGAGQDFAGGKVYFTPETGAHAVTGDILAEYESVGGPTGELGYPTAAEADGGVPDSRVETFSATDNPVIFWTKDHGAIIVRGAMKAAWDKIGGATGALGVPTEQQNTDNGVTTQKFSGGSVSFDSNNNTFTTDPANLADQLAGLEVPAGPTPSTPAAPPAPEKNTKFTWQNWWLWWIIPLAVLLLGSIAAWVVMRGRRSRDGVQYDDDVDAEHEYDTDYQEPASDGHWAPFDQKADRAGYAEPDDDDDERDETPGYLSEGSGSSWSGEEAPTMRIEDRRDEGLFTHHGAHESDDVDEFDDEEPDPDDVDTDPTGFAAVQVDDLDDDEDEDEEQSGRHARSSWAGLDDDAYLPGPGSLFAPVYGAAPPPREPAEGRFARSYEEPETDDYDADDYDADADDDDHDEAAYDYRDDDYEDTVDTHSDAGAPPAIHLPLDDPHEAPEGYPIKGSMRTGRYHLPGSRFYDETVAEIWFASAELAEANGFLRAD